MIRLCTHCKKADTGIVDFKYCYPCHQKLLAWLDSSGQSEPNSIVPNKASITAGQRLLQNAVRKTQYGGTEGDKE